MATNTEALAVDDIVYSESDGMRSREELTLVTDTTVLMGAVVGGKRAFNTLTLTSTGSATETFIIDGLVYTLIATVTEVEGLIDIAATDELTILNLVNAINATGDGVPGVDYAALQRPHPTVTAKAGAGATLIITAKVPGLVGNSIPTTETSAVGSWTAATCAGGTDADGLNADGTEPEGQDAVGIALEAVTGSAAGKKIPVLVRDAVVNAGNVTYGSADSEAIVDAKLKSLGIILREEA